MKIKVIIPSTFFMLLLLVVAGCGTEGQTNNDANHTAAEPTAQEQATAVNDAQNKSEAAAETKARKSISEQVQGTTDLTVFADAFEKSGLMKSLNSTGPYTVFVPSNQAFEALPGGTVDDLLKPENRQKLAEILNNHIVAGKLDAAALQHGSNIKTLGNGQLQVSKQEEEIVMLNGAKVEKADINCSNGVIHVIDKVLMPDQKN